MTCLQVALEMIYLMEEKARIWSKAKKGMMFSMEVAEMICFMGISHLTAMSMD